MSESVTDSGVLARFSDDLATAVETAGQYVVAVKARRRVPGSGVLWSPAGTIITADHVLERDEDIRVVLADGRELPATLVGRDPSSDLAVLRVAAEGLPTAAVADGDAVRVGHFVLALGRSGRGPASASVGIVGAVGGPWRSRRGATVEGYLQTDLTLYPGFSGGPLVDARGRSDRDQYLVARPRPVDGPAAGHRPARRRGAPGAGAHPPRLPGHQHATRSPCRRRCSASSA